MAEDPSARGAERVMIEIYRRFPSYMGTTLTAVVERLLEGGAPMLVHCSAGKDRTGFVIAMLLHALDVPEPLIREDYLASRHWPGSIHHRASLAERLGRFMPASELAAAVDTVIDVREVYLDAALGAATAEFGSISRIRRWPPGSMRGDASYCVRRCSSNADRRSRPDYFSHRLNRRLASAWEAGRPSSTASSPRAIPRAIARAASRYFLVFSLCGLGRYQFAGLVTFQQLLVRRFAALLPSH